MSKSKKKLEIQKIEKVEDLEIIKGNWNVLLEHSETKTVELTHEWQMTYWKYFNENSELFVLIVKQAGSIVAIAPLRLTYTKRFGIAVRNLEFIAAAESNYQDFIIGNNKEEALECILNYLMSHKRSWDMLTLTHIPETSTTAHFFLNKLDDSLLCRVADIEKCVFLTVDTTWEEYAANSKKSRSKIAYRMRRLRKYGKIDCFHCLDEEQFRANLLKFFELHRKRWNNTETPSQFDDSTYCQFYLEVTPQLLPKRQIDLYVLETGEVPVAFLYSFLFDRSCLIQLIAYDIEYSKAAPSLVMHELFVKEAFANDVEVIDFGHYYPYKEYWASGFKKRLNIEIYPERFLPYCVYILATVTSALRASLKQITPLREFVRYIRRKVRSVPGASQWGAR